MIRFSKFDKEYMTHDKDDLDHLMESNDEGAGDPYYYDALSMVGCDAEKFCTADIDDVDPKDWEKLFYYIENHTVNKIDHGEYTSGYPYSGLTDEYYIRTDKDNYYTIVYGIDYGYEWLYFSEDFIEEYSKSQRVEVELDSYEVPYES